MTVLDIAEVLTLLFAMVWMVLLSLDSAHSIYWRHRNKGDTIKYVSESSSEGKF